MDFYEDGEGNLCCDLPFTRIETYYDSVEVLMDSRFTLEELEEIVAKMKELRAKNGNEKTSI